MEGTNPEFESSDEPTVVALASLLRQSGGRRRASAVGLLYNDAGGVHRNTIRSHGGVAGFVKAQKEKAHGDIFALEAACEGESCPSIRLRSGEERASAAAEVAAAMAVALAKKPPCRFFLLGQCTRGAGCRFSHVPPAAENAELPPAPVVKPAPEDAAAGGPGDAAAGDSLDEHWAEKLRAQVAYYFSDENLRRDAFFQAIIASTVGGWVDVQSILKCRKVQRLGVTAPHVVSALRDEPCFEVRDAPAGSEAVRRVSPHPPLEEQWLPTPYSPPDARAVTEPLLTEQPLELLRDRSAGWQAVIEDTERRSFMFVKRNIWPMQLLLDEFNLIKASTSWAVLRSKKEGAVTRSTAWFVPEGCKCRYTYSDVSMEPQERPAWLQEVEARVLGEGCGLSQDEWPNSVNMNFYEASNQNVGWHSDDEAMFGGCSGDCRIISASWGVARTFEAALKDHPHASGRVSIHRESIRTALLLPGDLCSMEGRFQKHYSHQLAKGLRYLHEKPLPLRKRVNFTWRHLVHHKAYCPLAYKHR